MPIDPLILRRATSHLRRADPVLDRVIASVGPCRFGPARSGRPFAALVEAILCQQITGRAAEPWRPGRSIAGGYLWRSLDA